MRFLNTWNSVVRFCKTTIFTTPITFHAFVLLFSRTSTDDCGTYNVPIEHPQAELGIGGPSRMHTFNLQHSFINKSRFLCTIFKLCYYTKRMKNVIVDMRHALNNV
jgi:hypothetical protein